MRCNIDVTCLLSDTAIKAVISYIANYITKSLLNTVAMFDLMTNVFEQNMKYIKGDVLQEEKTRKIMTQIVNSFTSKQETRSPLACMYLLGHFDHYTNRRFISFY